MGQNFPRTQPGWEASEDGESLTYNWEEREGTMLGGGVIKGIRGALLALFQGPGYVVIAEGWCILL